MRIFKMGGCRCTYRNCNVKSDGKTHMFHYPVFERVRCHQWLVNAHRLDFLDLKVSQVKNRVVCQHHFKEDNFMNYKKDKLTFDAVPTEDGPFCDSTKFLGYEDPKKYSNLILLEDIENDFIFMTDKKANFSVKYGDFLTNNEFMDSSARYNRNNINLTKESAIINLNSSLDNDKKLFEPGLFQSQNTRLSLPSNKINKVNIQPTLVVPPYSDLSNELKMGKELNLDQNLNDLNLSNSKPLNINNISENENVIPLLKTNNISELNKPKSVNKESKIRILSEKKIKGPIAITGKFEKVLPTTTLNLPDKSHIKTRVEKEPEITENTVIVEPDKPSDKLKVLEVLEVEFDPTQSKVEAIHKVTTTDKIDTNVKQSPVKKYAQIRNKVTPERSAAIEKKRKFNMRLKDIIESCLDKLDEPVKNESESILKDNFETSNGVKQHDITSSENQIKSTEAPTSSCVIKDSSMPVQEYTIAYLEARMKKMENTLLNKIEQNSRKIMDLKDSCVVVNKSKELGKKCISTQTNVNAQCYKKYLYHEISKYLSPSTNSTIYEELFINKYSCDDMKSPLKRKRRKCN